MTYLEYANWVPLPAPVTSGTTVQSFTAPDGEVWVAKNGVNSGNWFKARDVINARALLGSVSPSGITALPITLPATFDVYGGFASTAGYTCPIAGRYQVNVIMTVNAVPSSNNPVYRIQRNSGDVASGNYYQQGGTAQNYTFAINDILVCAAGDVLRAAVGNTGGTGSSGALSVAYLGTG